MNTEDLKPIKEEIDNKLDDLYAKVKAITAIKDAQSAAATKRQLLT